MENVSNKVYVFEVENREQIDIRRAVEEIFAQCFKGKHDEHARKGKADGCPWQASELEKGDCPSDPGFQDHRAFEAWYNARFIKGGYEQMAIKSFRLTTPSRRSMTVTDYSVLSVKEKSS